jgi:protein phosphatase
VALAREDLGVYVVSDGAGGHNAGEVAAEIAVSCIAKYFESTPPETQEERGLDAFGVPVGARRLSAAIHRANREVIGASKRSEQHRGMGSTVVAAFFSAGAGVLHVAHVGDSRCYRYRAPHLELLTQDHSLVMDVLEQRPDLEAAVLARLPKHVVTRALGMNEQLRVSLSSYAVAAGDRYLLCSDGLSSPVRHDAIAQVLASDADPETMARRLIELANGAGGPDNIAALVVHCSGGRPSEPAPMPEPLDAAPDSDEDPEILILGIEELDPEERPHTASDGLLKTLGELIKRGK